MHLRLYIVLFGFVLQRVDIRHRWQPVYCYGHTRVYLSAEHSHRSKEAINANDTLFTYRQVFPVDTVLVRAALEGLFLLISALFLFTGLGLFGYEVVSSRFFASDVGLSSSLDGRYWPGAEIFRCISVDSRIGKVSGMLFGPLYFLSGIMYPPSAIPPAYQSWFLLNPFVHGIETVRTGFFPQYHTISGVSMGYLLGFAMVTICLGLALHVRFATRLVAK